MIFRLLLFTFLLLSSQLIFSHAIQELSYKNYSIGSYGRIEANCSFDEQGSVTKFSIVPTGEKSLWARPHIRFIYTIAFYNEFAKNNLYSPYLQVAGPKSVGHYFGVRAEWWIW